MSIINYTIHIKNIAIERRRSQLLPLHALASLAIILLIPSIIIISASYIYSIISCSILAVLFFVIPFVLYKKDKLKRWNTIIRYSEAFIVGIIGCILLMNRQWLVGINGILWSAVFIFLSNVEKSVFKPQQITIHTTAITYSHVLYPISIQWNNIKEIVIRRDYISIFKKNGRYLQFEITDDLSDLQLKEINELCTKLIVDNV